LTSGSHESTIAICEVDMADFLIAGVVCAFVAFGIVRRIYGKVFRFHNWKPLFIFFWVALMGLVSFFAVEVSVF
jgi:hypothetical protein